MLVKPGYLFTFRILPRAVEQAKVENIADHQPQALPRGNETILVVDDEAALLELAREALEKQGYHVLTACDGKEALERLAEHPTISLLFSDMVMPSGMNGYELAQQAMENRSDLKVLLTSGLAEKAKGKAGLKTNLLMKPYTHVDLARRVQSVLSESKTAFS